MCHRRAQRSFSMYCSLTYRLICSNSELRLFKSEAERTEKKISLTNQEIPEMSVNMLKRPRNVLKTS
jgi:hypothetical protein